MELQRFKQRIARDGLCVTYVNVDQGGKRVAAYDRLGGQTRLNTWSVAKSFVSVGVGIAMVEGLLRPDTRLCDVFPERVPKNAGENLLSVTVRDMLTMTTGLETPLFFTDDPARLKITDWIGHFFAASFPYPPGARFLYSNFNTYMLSCMIEKKTGMRLVDYLRPRLFEKIDIFCPEWMCDPMGHQTAANGLYLTIDEYSRFGRMLLGRGVYNGVRVVDEAYLDAATRVQTTLPGSKDGYGYQFWINPGREGYRADGKYGQFIIVLPEKDAVVSVMSLEGRKSVFPAVWEEIVSQL